VFFQWRDTRGGGRTWLHTLHATQDSFNCDWWWSSTPRLMLPLYPQTRKCGYVLYGCKQSSLMQRWQQRRKTDEYCRESESELLAPVLSVYLWSISEALNFLRCCCFLGSDWSACVSVTTPHKRQQAHSCLLNPRYGDDQWASRRLLIAYQSKDHQSVDVCLSLQRHGRRTIIRLETRRFHVD